MHYKFQKQLNRLKLPLSVYLIKSMSIINVYVYNIKRNKTCIEFSSDNVRTWKNLNKITVVSNNKPREAKNSFGNVFILCLCGSKLCSLIC